MDITTEYARLKALAATPEGWQEIERAWYEKLRDSKPREGRDTVGFAIDTETKRCIVDTNSLDHDRPRRELVALLKTEAGEPEEKVQFRVVKGWVFPMPGFAFPCIFMGSPRFMLGASTPNLELIEELETALLEQGIGMSIAGMYMRHLVERGLHL